MLTFAIQRALTAALTLLAASALVFLVLEVLPGDPALLILGEGARPDTLAALRQELGLDDPAVTRYLRWLAGFVTGDLGSSLTYGAPVAELLAERSLITLPMAALALVLALPLAIGLGTWAASRRGTLDDHLVRLASHLGLALPSFWIGIMLIFLFAISLTWTTAGGFPGWQAGVGPALAALLLPALALALPEAAIVARITRGAVLEALTAEFVRTARAKGLGRRRVLLGHVLGHAAIPVLTIAGLQFGFLMAGAILVERVFAIGGLGELLLNAAGQRDLPVIKGAVVLICAVVVAANLVVDLLNAVIDPRLRAAGPR